MKNLVLGNEALAQGAIDAGISGVYAYPGTPSTEITEYIQTSKIAKEKAIQSLDDEIISLHMQEKEINSIKNIARQTGNILHFEKLSRLKLKISDQKLKTLSAKTNLINTPTFADMIRLENKDE